MPTADVNDVTDNVMVTETVTLSAQELQALEEERLRAEEEATRLRVQVGSF